MKARRMLVAALVGVGLVASATAPAMAAEPSAETARCVHGHWPAAVQGKPAGLEAGSAAGLYVWHTDDGWEVAVTHPGTDKMVFAGRIASGGELYGVAVRTERRDLVRFTQGGNRSRIDYRFTNYGRIDGIHFRARCAKSLRISGTLDGKPLTSDQVFVGADGHHPDAVPFSIVRIK